VMRPPKATSAKVGTRWVLPAAAAIVVAAAVGVWAWSARSAPAPLVEPPSTAAVGPGGAAAGESPAAVPSPAVPPAPPPAAAPKPAAPRASADSARPVGTGDKALLARLREGALVAKRQATEASAAPELIARGDSLLRRAESLRTARHTAEAAAEYSAAAAVWGGAAKAAQAESEPAVSPPVTESPQVTAPPAPAPPAAPPTAAPTHPAAPPAPPADPSPRIRALFDEYAAALGTRSMANIRQAYPGLTTEQAKEWEQFFSAVSDIEVTLQVTRLDVHGDTGEASLSGVYAFTDPATRRPRRDNVNLLATLRRDARGWRIESLR
jgi:hypothetical protein